MQRPITSLGSVIPGPHRSHYRWGGIHDGPIDANDYHASPIAPSPTPRKRKKKVVQ